MGDAGSEEVDENAEPSSAFAESFALLLGERMGEASDPRQIAQLSLTLETLAAHPNQPELLAKPLARLYTLTTDPKDLAAYAKLESVYEDLMTGRPAEPAPPPAAEAPTEQPPTPAPEKSDPTPEPPRILTAAQRGNELLAMRTYRLTGSVPGQVAHAVGLLKRSGNSLPNPYDEQSSSGVSLKSNIRPADKAEAASEDDHARRKTGKPSRLLGQIPKERFEKPLVEGDPTEAAVPDAPNINTVHNNYDFAKRRKAVFDDGWSDEFPWEITVRKHRRTATTIFLSMLVVGGLSGLGFAFAQWMTVQGDAPTVAVKSDMFETNPEDFFEKFVNVSEWREMLPFVRHPEIVEPLMKRWYGETPFVPGRPFQIHSRQEGIIDSTDGDGNGEKWISLLLVEFDDGETSTVFVENVDGQLKIDWESYVRYQGSDWEEFVEVRPQEPRFFRLQVRLDNYHNYQFSNSEKWLSFMVTEPFSGRYIHAFADRESDAGRDLLRFAANQGTFPAILGLRFLDGDTAKDVVQITSLVQKEWLGDYRGHTMHFDLNATRWNNG